MAGVSLPNIIMDREIVREFIQIKMTFGNVKEEMQKLLYNENYRAKIMQDYSELLDLMGEAGSSKKAAKKMTELLTLNF
jgi:lipid-A-disaccharide synthase